MTKNLIAYLKLSPFYDLIIPIIHSKELASWDINKSDNPTPSLIKQKYVKDYASKYLLNTMIETGTYTGNMIKATKYIFKKIYSIELDRSLYENAKRKFRKDKHITLIQGDSAKKLPLILKKIKEPSLFWLDAHFSEGITALGDMKTPITKELQAILNHRIKNHVILIDDAANFIGQNDYPTISNLKKNLKKHNKYKIKIENKIIIVEPLKKVASI